MRGQWRRQEPAFQCRTQSDPGVWPIAATEAGGVSSSNVRSKGWNLGTKVASLVFLMRPLDSFYLAKFSSARKGTVSTWLYRPLGTGRFIGL